MQSRRVVLLHHEAVARLGLDLGRRLGCVFETTFSLILFESHCK